MNKPMDYMRCFFESNGEGLHPSGLAPSAALYFYSVIAPVDL